MRYLFTITNTPGQPEMSAAATVINKRQMPFLSVGVLDYTDPPVAQYKVDLVEPETPEGFPMTSPPDDHDGDPETIDVFAWREFIRVGERFDVIMLEWADGSVEVTLPEHDATGINGKPTDQGESPDITDEELEARIYEQARVEELDIEKLRELVIEGRVANCFGDGMEREYAEAGGCTLGDPVAEMTREQLLTELGYETSDIVGSDVMDDAPMTNNIPKMNITLDDVIKQGEPVFDWLVENCGFTSGGYKLVSVARVGYWPDSERDVNVATIWVEDDNIDDKKPVIGQTLVNGRRYYVVSIIVAV